MRTTKFLFTPAIALMLLCSLASKAQTQQLSPMPYPQFQHTGNPEADKKAHEQAVKKWEAHEAERKAQIKTDGKMLNSDMSKPGIVKEANGQKVKQNAHAKKVHERKIIQQPNAPVYKATGNEQEDQRVYAERKKEWIKNHPEEYRRSVNNLKSNQKKSTRN